MRAAPVFVFVVVAGVLACGGLGAASTEAPPPPTVVEPAASISFGVPPGWEKSREELDEDGEPVVYYSIEGEHGLVQLELRKADRPVPVASQLVDGVRASVLADLGAQGDLAVRESFSFGEVQPVDRELSGAVVTGASMTITQPGEGGPMTGLHRVWVVQGQQMTAVVTVDVPDVSVVEAEAQIDEVLNNLVVP